MGNPQYDAQALVRAVEAIDRDIASMELAISELRKRKSNYQALLVDALRLKKDNDST